MTDFSKMTDEEYYILLQQVINEECCAADLLRIPGIYEILSEHFNNEILTRWENHHDDEEDVLDDDEDDHYNILMGNVR